MASSNDFYDRAISLRSRILDGSSNQSPILAWADVAKACVNASNARRKEALASVWGALMTSDMRFLNQVEQVRWWAMANVENLRK